MTTDPGLLVVRTDAGTQIGVGHALRCLALAQAWQDAGGSVTFALASSVEDVDRRLESEGVKVARIDRVPGTTTDASSTRTLCDASGAAWLVLDGFHFSPSYCRSVRDGAGYLLLFDDHGQRPAYECDVVLNTNPYAVQAMYPTRESEVRFLLGRQYALLRREFLLQTPKVDVPKNVRRVLVTFGGSDPHNVTLQVVEWLRELAESLIEVVVLAGASNPHRAILQDAVRPAPNFHLFSNPRNVPELMASADLAISAGGGTCYELAYLDVPMLLVTMAENHQQTVEAFAVGGAAVNAGWFTSLRKKDFLQQVEIVLGDQKLRAALVENARAMVDGHGAARVIATLTAHTASCAV